jgi:hypothetical protein
MFADMAVTVEIHHTGDPELRADVVAAIEHVFADRSGDYRVLVLRQRPMFDQSNNDTPRDANPSRYRRWLTLATYTRCVLRDGGDPAKRKNRYQQPMCFHVGIVLRACWKAKSTVANHYTN